MHHGTEAWHYTVKEVDWVIDAGPGRGVLIAGNGVELIDLHTGRPKWKVLRQLPTVAIAVGIDGPIYVITGMGDNKLYALDVSSGETRWQVTFGAGYANNTFTTSNVLLSSGDMVFIAPKGKSYCRINSITGAEMWRQSIPERNVDSLYSVTQDSDGGLYLICSSNLLTRISPDTGGILWRAELPGGKISAPVSVRSGIIACSGYGSITLLNKNLGSVEGHSDVAGIFDHLSITNQIGVSQAVITTGNAQTAYAGTGFGALCRIDIA